MSKIDVSVEIDAAPEHVWQVVEPIENHVDWMRDAVAIHFQNDQTRGVGTTFLCDTKVGPIKLVDRMEITDWTPNSSMGVRHTGIITGSGLFSLIPIDLGRRTRFSWTEELRFPWWLGGRVGAFVGAKLIMKPIWKRNLRGLKQVVEGSDRRN